MQWWFLSLVVSCYDFHRLLRLEEGFYTLYVTRVTKIRKAPSN